VACLDTTILIDLSRRRSPRRPRAAAKMRELLDRDESLVTTRINLAELYVGIQRSDDPKREERIVAATVEGLEILEFDDWAARLFGETTAYLYQIGQPAGDMDVLIAAICVASSEVLVTGNAAHFANVPDLIVETY